MGLSTVNAKTETGHGVVEKLYGEPGTVGAVAIDKDGNIAAATSTGGMTGKMVGRIGDSPLLGSGTYADNNSGKFHEFKVLIIYNADRFRWCINDRPR